MKYEIMKQNTLRAGLNKSLCTKETESIRTQSGDKKKSIYFIEEIRFDLFFDVFVYILG